MGILDGSDHNGRGKVVVIRSSLIAKRGTNSLRSREGEEEKLYGVGRILSSNNNRITNSPPEKKRRRLDTTQQMLPD